MDCRLSCLHGRLEEGICFPGEDKREGYRHSINTNIISYHITIYEVLLRTRIDHCSQSIFD